MQTIRVVPIYLELLTYRFCQRVSVANTTKPWIAGGVSCYIHFGAAGDTVGGFEDCSVGRTNRFPAGPLRSQLSLHWNGSTTIVLIKRAHLYKINDSAGDFPITWTSDVSKMAIDAACKRQLVLRRNRFYIEIYFC